MFHQLWGFKSGDLARWVQAIVQAVMHYSDPDESCELGEARLGLISDLNDDDWPTSTGEN